MLLTTFATLLILYALYNGILYFAQERLIFAGVTPNYLLYEQLDDYAMAISSAGNCLRGWKIPGSCQSNGTVAIFFGGNAQDVGAMHPVFAELAVQSTYAFNYRGYGLSTGEPSETALFQDALMIFDTVTKANPGKTIAIIGQSLGSAVAGYVAANRPVQKLVLITPLSSIADVVRWRLKSTFPTFLVKHHFDLGKSAKVIDGNALVITAGTDTVIPRHFSMKTYNELSAKKHLLDVPGAHHNNVFAYEATVLTINRFLTSQA